MMRRILATLIFAISTLIVAGLEKVSANEGTAVLLSDSVNARCFVASVFVDEGDYRILLTCENLTLPPSSEKLFYHVWAKKASAVQTTGAPAKPGGKFLTRSIYLSLGNLQNGKLSVRAREAFTDVFITAEKESDSSEPTLPSMVVSGTIQPIDFGTGRASVIAKPTESVARVTMGPTARPTPAVSGKSVVGTAFRVFLTVLGIIVAVAVVISIIQRRSARS